MIRLIIIDDHPVSLIGLKGLFHHTDEGIRVIESFSNAEKAISKADPGSFDIIILDLWLNRKHPLENFTTLSERFPGKPVIMFTSEEENEWKETMFKAGAKGYLLKSAEKKEIKFTIEKVFLGETVMVRSGKAVQPLKSRPVIRPSGMKLTKSQVQILSLLGKGYPERRIAGEMQVSLSCLAKTISHLKEVMIVKTTAGLIHMAFK